MLEVSNLHVFYGTIHALKGISLHVDRGEIVTLVGSNGAGKSTTLLSIAGILKPEKESRIGFEGAEITGLPSARIVKNRIVLSPEGREVFPGMGVEQNLMLGAYTCKKKAKIKENLDKVYTLFPRLKERRSQTAGTLSGGEQQMLAIGRALMSDPELLMLDEPSMGLAPNLVKMIFELIVRINKMGTTIFLIEQNANMALKIADRAYVLETGKIKLEGNAKELLTNDEVRKAYLGV